MGQRRAWTEEELRHAVATSTTYSMVLQKLGLRAGSLGYLKGQIERRELDTSHFIRLVETQMSCSDDALRELVPRARSATEILLALGVELQGINFRRIRQRISMLGLDTSHFKRERPDRIDQTTRWTNDELISAVQSSRSYAQAIRKLGLIPAGGNYDHVQRRIAELGIDTSHFTGKGWNTGGKFRPLPALPLDKVLVADRWTPSHRLKLRLFREGLKEPRCELCGWAQRTADGRIPVELDHINGNKSDNRLENLRVLCPNCHSLQGTHRGLNKRSRRERTN